MSPASLSRPLLGMVWSSRLFGGLAAAALLVGCGENKDPLDTIGGITASAGPTGGSNTNPSGNPSGGDPTDGGTDGSTESGAPTEGTTTSGGAHGDCDQFLQCVGVVSPDSLAELEPAYGPEGTCWSTPEQTEQCLQACSEGLASFGTLYPDEPACGGSGTSTTSVSTTGPLTSTTDPWTSTTDPWTSTSVDPETTGTPYGNCGWDGANAFYACGFMGEDPGGTNPIDCPPDVMEGAPCDETTAVNGIGCCTLNGDNYYCSAENTVFLASCGP
ncbi:hypothetical protein [Nannocystis radixulma]|uniref:Uncharacterized protein n=1 Tax=Nannocystis radixulma TaxID=2995305 RepID=A0ABT5B8Y3_9BACT|nr:hypothetical protein [Nannocystis radixulma]MDC0670577.1 hypothetical protein [Nannocystis radixulma]